MKSKPWIIDKAGHQDVVMYFVCYLDCTFYFQIVFYGYLTIEFMTGISYNVSKWTISRMDVSVNTFG
jgi:hypothetical protein